MLTFFSTCKFLQRKEKLILFLVLFLVASLYSFISIAKHDRFETFGWDLAFQDQMIWQWSQFKVAYMSMKDNLNSLGDHFTLMWLSLVPLYWIKSDPKTLLAAQAFVVTFSALPLYFLSKKILESQFLSFAIILMYLFFVSLQHGIFNDVHSAMFTTIFITSLYFFGEKKNWPAYWLSAIGLTFTKEEFGLLVAAIGIVLILRGQNLKHGILSIIFGIGVFLFLTVYLMPFAALTPKFVHANFGIAGSTIPEVAGNILKNPNLLVSTLLDSLVKQNTLLSYFSSFGFLPLLSPVNLLPILQQIFIRFIDSYHPIRWMADNHYSASSAALLAISTIYGASNLIRISKKFKLFKNIKFYLAILILFVTLAQDFVYHGPVNSIFKGQFYERYSWMKDNEELVNLIPKNTSVATTNNLASHLSQRKLLYLLPDVNSADYIAVDLLDGPNKYAPTDISNIKALIEEVKKDPDYKLIFQKGEAYLFKRVGAKNGPGHYRKFYVPQPS